MALKKCIANQNHFWLMNDLMFGGGILELLEKLF